MEPKLTCPSHEVVQRYDDRSNEFVTANVVVGSNRDGKKAVIEESAVAEDDDYWEDEPSEEEEGSMTQPLFQKVSSTTHLLSASSCLTHGLISNDGGKSSGNTVSPLSASAVVSNKTTSSDGSSSFAASPKVNGKDRDQRSIMLRPRVLDRDAQNPPAKTQAAYSMAYSPRTVKREMLSTELTDELRRQLQRERRQISTPCKPFLARNAKYGDDMQGAVQQASMRSPPLVMQIDNGGESIWSSERFWFSNDYHTRGW